MPTLAWGLAALLTAAAPSKAAPSKADLLKADPLKAAPFRFSPRPNQASQVHWQVWGQPVFEQARREHKLVFLNLAASWCHWCHVLDETTLSDPKVIALLNEKFVPVRVDADQNPQVERRYLQGGWPTTAFLDEGGEVLSGATYVPADRLLAMARATLELQADPVKLRTALGEPERPEADARAPGALPDQPGLALARSLVGGLNGAVGGFGAGSPRFPQGLAQALLGAEAQMHDDAALGQAVAASLERMARSPLRDLVGGGFYRYSTQPDWSAPHYEKMLGSSSELLMAYAEAYAARPSEPLRQAGLSLAGYLTQTLWSEPSGGLWASQDADEAYSTLDAAGRAKRKPPAIDRTFLTDRNGLAVRALVRAAVVFEEPELGRYAQRAADFLLQRLRTPEGAFFHALVPGGEPQLPGLLADQAQAALALLDVAEWTGEERYLEAAQQAVQLAQAGLSTGDGSAYYDLPAAAVGPGRVAARLVELEDNALLAWALARLAGLTEQRALLAQAQRTLAAFAGRAQGLAAATWGRAADEAQGQALRLVVVGPAADARTQALFEAARALKDPRRHVRRLVGPVALGALTFPGGAPAAYVCAGAVCSPPVRDPAKLPEVAQGLLRPQRK
jgi:hypothetical protein